MKTNSSEMEAMSMYERFTDRARKVLQLANQEATRCRHQYIGTEHLLLGLVKEGSGVAANVLKNLDVELSKVRREVEQIILPGATDTLSGKLPQTPRVKKVIEWAIEEARGLNHNYVGTEHLLLGLLREHDGVAAQVLMNLGLNLKDVREEVLNLLGPSSPSGVSVPGQGVADPDREARELPGPVQETVQGITEYIEHLKGRKEEAIARQDFERAAFLRDTADRLKRRIRKIRNLWPADYAIDPTWLSWNNGQVQSLAMQIRQEARWDNLPALADALEEAGCADRRLLDHCRQSVQHPHGCWVIDLLLGEVPQVSG
jgi:ATP-dependent Clp protease ATP-binding subunit ClpA